MLRTFITCVVGALVVVGCQRSAETKPVVRTSLGLTPLSIVVTDDNGQPLPATESRCGKKDRADYGDCTIPVIVLWESDTKCWALLPYNKLSMYFAGLPLGHRKVEWRIFGNKDAEFTDLSMSKNNAGDSHAPDDVWDKDDSDKKAYKVLMKDGAPANKVFKHKVSIKTKDANGAVVTCLPIDPLIVNID